MYRNSGKDGIWIYMAYVHINIDIIVLTLIPYKLSSKCRYLLEMGCVFTYLVFIVYYYYYLPYFVLFPPQTTQKLSLLKNFLSHICRGWEVEGQGECWHLSIWGKTTTHIFVFLIPSHRHKRWGISRCPLGV